MEIRAWRIHEYGSADVLRLDTVTLPPLAPDRVRVRVKAMGLNRSDILWTTGGFFKPALPSRLGAEICGIVEEVGAAVGGFKPGDRVSNVPIMYADIYSNFADCADIPAEALVHTPPRLSDAEGAAFMFTHLTQMCGLAELGQLRAGQVLLVTAASSANGLSALALGRLLGARVIAVTRRSAKRAMLLDAGADHVVAYEEEDLAARVLALTDGAGANLAWDCVGGGLSAGILGAMAVEGRWIMYGFLDPAPVTVHWAQWFMRQITFNIFSMTQYTGNELLQMPGRPIEFRRALQATMALATDGRLPVPIAATLQGMDKVPEAFRLMESNAGGGKIVILS